jgi:hypothetical protein
MLRTALVAAVLAGSLPAAFACSLSPDFKPPTAITGEEIVFVGTVVSVGWAGRTFSDPKALDAARALCFGVPAQRDPACLLNHPTGEPETVTFAVEAVARGRVGETYQLPQGGGGDCTIGFDLGKRYFFAGTFILGMTRMVAPGEPAEDILERYMPAE